MPDHSNQPKPNLRDELKDGMHKLKDGWDKFTSKFGPASSPQPSRSQTPAPSNTEGSSPGATPIVPSNTGSAPSSIDNGEDSAKGGNTAQIDTPATPLATPGEFDWQAWNIDGNAISELRAWGAGHGESNWRKLADKIDHCLKSKTLEAVQDFIPDSPVPAKTLVKALLSIVELGVSVPGIQKKVYDFAQEAIEYIRTLVEAVDEEQAMKPNLVQICATVNDICGWASKHVRKIKLSADDLEEWDAKFAVAKQMFLTMTVISIRVEQERAKRMVVIREKLANHVATKHEYTDQEKSLCAANTRVDIQTEITQWLSPQTSSSERIFWITGIAGSGKSTLSATVADTLGKNKTPVAAQFFISRNIPETINPKNLVPTIAKQLAEFSPAAARIIHDTLKNFVPSSLEDQVKELLLAPIQEICKSHDRVVILIDALDELENAAENVLQMLLPIAPKGCNLPDNVKFVITSRPERWADISISKTLELAVFKQRPLLTESSVEEVHNFICARMDKILAERREENPADWEGWPSKHQLLDLSEKADGLFHYAATALQWIKEQIPKYGMARRNQVFEKITQLGIGQLEGLYRLVLTAFENIDIPAQETDWRASQLCGFQHVIGTILVLEKPLTIRQITALLADISDFDVTNFLRQFCSVLIPGTTISFEEATPQMHKSFRDYITGANAPENFRISIGHAHFVTARSCMEVIIKAAEQPDIDSQYSVEHWYQHLQQAVEAETPFVDERMWELFGGMAGDTIVNIWKANSWPVFLDVATAGWKLLQRGHGDQEMEGISNIVKKAKEREFEEERTFRAARFERERQRFEEETGIPYTKIWDKGLLETFTDTMKTTYWKQNK